MNKQEELQLNIDRCLDLVKELNQISMNLPNNYGFFEIIWMSGVTTDVVRSTFTRIDLRFIENVDKYRENTHPIIAMIRHHLKDDLDSPINLWKEFYTEMIKNMTLGKKSPPVLVKGGTIAFIKPIGLFMTEGITADDLRMI